MSIYGKTTKCIHCNLETLNPDGRCNECRSEMIDDDLIRCPKCGLEEDAWGYEKTDDHCINASCDSCGEDYKVSLDFTVHYVSPARIVDGK